MSVEPTTPDRRRVLVTGSRTWTDTATIREALEQQWGDGTAILVTGACSRGADALAEQCWTAWGGQVERHPADWDRHGRSAGYRRNADMVASGADVCLAFLHGPSHGTRHTADLAVRADIPTRHFHHPPPDSESPAMPGPNRHNQDHHDAAAGEPSIAEIAALTSRLRHLRSPDATDAERAAFIADKNALIARILGDREEADYGSEPTERRAAVSPIVAAAHATAEDDQTRSEHLCRLYVDDQAEARTDDSGQDDAGWSQ